mmetsp:Transcript_74533/g.193750  ORF Transcript_74533/g.193750 Transcript_74533/m.193750 type:complete len:582 (+) Transcript_74533:89-1834(+)
MFRSWPSPLPTPSTWVVVGAAGGAAIAVVAALKDFSGLWFGPIMRCRAYPRLQDGRPVEPVFAPTFPFGNMARLMRLPPVEQFKTLMQASAKTLGYAVTFILSRPRVNVIDNDEAVKVVLGAKVTVARSDRTIGKQMPVWDRLFGKGLFMVGPTDWKRQHRICMRGFGPKMLDRFASVVADTVASEFKALEGAAAGDRHPLQRSHSGRTLERQATSLGICGNSDGQLAVWDPAVFLKTMAARVISKVAFGQGIDVDDESAIAEAFSVWEQASSDPRYLLPYYIDLPFSGPRAARKAIKGLHMLAEKFIARERETIAAGDEHQNLLSVLVHARDDDGGKLDEDELVHNVYSFLGAGVSTTSDALATILFLLARHPEIQSKLHQELATGPLEWEFVKNLPYLSAVIAESLRLWPSVVGSIARQLTDDVVLPGGLRVGKGINVGVNSATLQRRPGVWGADADKFRPERFIEGQGKDQGIGNPMSPHKLPPGVPDTAFPVFGYGARPCIGRPLAVMEMKMTLAQALRRFSIEEMEPESFEMVLATPFQFPKRSLKLGLRRRSQQFSESCDCSYSGSPRLLARGGS